MQRSERLIKILDYIFLACIGLFVFTNSVWGEMGAWRFTVYLVTAAMIAVFVIRTTMRKEIVFGPSVPLILLFLVANILAWLFNMSAAPIPQTPVLCSVMFLFVYLFAKNSDIRLDKMVFSFFFGILAFALVFIFHYRNELLHFNTELRLGDYFDNINNVAYYLLYGSTASLYLAYKNKKIVHKILFYLAEAIFFFLLLSTGSRSALLINVILFFLELYFAFGKKRPAVFLGVTVLVAGLGLLVCFTVPSIQPLAQRYLNAILSILGVESRESSTAARLTFPLQAIPIFLARPLFGWGRNYASNFVLENVSLHNNFANLLVDSGIMGFIPFEALLVLPIVNSFRQRKRSETAYHKYVLAILMALGIFLVQFFYPNSQQKTEFLIMAFVNGAIEKNFLKISAENNEGKKKLRITRAEITLDRMKI